MSIFGSRLKTLRLEQPGLTQEKLGRKFNVLKGAISNWENGNRFPDEATLLKLADYFEVSLDYLLGRTDKRQPSHLTKEDMIRLAPQYAWLFEEEGLEYVDLIQGMRTDDIPPEAIKETIELILKYRHLNK